MTPPGQCLAPQIAGVAVIRWRTWTCPLGYTDWAPDPQDRYLCARRVWHDAGSGQCPNDTKAGNPIDFHSWAKEQTEVDVPLAGLLGRALTRHYNSNFPLAEGSTFGARWRSVIDRSLQVVTSASARVAIISTEANALAAYRASALDWIRAVGSGGILREFRDGGGQTIGWRHTNVSNEVEDYDAAGRLVAVSTGNGDALTILRDAAGHVREVSDSFGRIARFQHDLVPGVLTKFRVRADLPDGRAIYYYFDNATDSGPVIGVKASVLTRVVYPDSATRSYEHLATSLGWGFNHALLTAIRDEKGVTYAQFGYDPVGRTMTTQLANGVFRFEAAKSSISDSIRTVRDPLGTTKTYTFGGAGPYERLVRVDQPAGAGSSACSSAATYDASGNAASRTDFRGNRTCYVYDLTRNLETKRVEGVGTTSCSAALGSPPAGARVITTEWHPDWRLATRVAEPKKITTSVYNGHGASCAPSTVLVDGKPPAVVCTRTEQATTDESGVSGFSATTIGTPRTWRTTYTTYGRVLTATDPNNRITTISYHADNDPDLGKRGNVASITNAANHITYLTDYNPHGQPTRIVDPNGVVTVLTYDPRMRLTSRSVGTEATVFGFDPVGQMTSVNLPDGGSLIYTYDAAHRLTAINDHKGNRIDYTLDAMGNRTAEQLRDPGGTLVKNIARVIDALNRVQQVTGAN